MGDDIVGRTGRLVLPTRGSDGPGEVLVTVRGSRETYIAWSPDPLPKGADVLIISHRGPRSVDVEPWTATSFDEIHS